MKIKFVVFLFMIFVPLSADASPFCIAGLGMPPQCIYDDIQVCQKAIKANNVSCVTNPEAVLTYLGGARYCRVTSYLSAECIFNDRAQCRKEATLRKEICIDRTSMADVNNPYQYDDRIQN